jgi:membrane-bound serine protease (ClpP class)
MLTFLAESAVPPTGSTGLVIILLVIGMIGVMVELFFLPGFGIPGIAGLVVLAVGCVVAWVFLGPVWGGVVIALTILLVVGLAFFVLRSRVMKRKFLLDASLTRGDGMASENGAMLLGLKGTAESDLRPAGFAFIDKRRVDVVSEGGFIEKGTEIKVVNVDGPRIVVASIK